MEELKTLPPHKLAEVVSYLHSLRETTLEERLAAWKSTGGSLSNEEVDEQSIAFGLLFNVRHFELFRNHDEFSLEGCHRSHFLHKRRGMPGEIREVGSIFFRA